MQPGALLASAALLCSPLAAAATTASFKLPISPFTYNNIVYFADFAAAAYANKCNKPAHGATVVRYFNDAATDTQATLFYVASSNQIILAFRGTSVAQDWTTDLQAVKVPLTLTGTKCSDCLVHQGFQTSYASIQAAVVSAVKSQLSAHPGAALYVTGHSLGAALASLASVSLVAAGTPVKAVYTYGEPLNGNPAWATYANAQVPASKYYRVTHANDGVPRIPPPQAGFAHHGTEFWESQATTAGWLTTFNCGQNSTQCNAQYPLPSDPINAAHLFYGKGLIANSLHIAACGAAAPLAS